MERDRFVDWRLLGPCNKLSSSQYDELFFPEAGRAIRKAKQFCNACPVSSQCLKLALDTDAKGIWAGTSEKERQEMKNAAKIIFRQPVKKKRLVIRKRTNLIFS